MSNTTSSITEQAAIVVQTAADLVERARADYEARLAAPGGPNRALELRADRAQLRAAQRAYREAVTEAHEVLTRHGLV